MPDERKDAGNVRAIPEAALKKAFELKEELSERSIREIIEILELSGDAPEGLLKNSTLSRIMSDNVQAAPKTKPAKVFGRFQKEDVNDTWRSDIKYLIYLKDPKEYSRTYLVCLLDDRNRKVWPYLKSLPPICYIPYSIIFQLI